MSGYVPKMLSAVFAPDDAHPHPGNDALADLTKLFAALNGKGRPIRKLTADLTTAAGDREKLTCQLRFATIEAMESVKEELETQFARIVEKHHGTPSTRHGLAKE